MNSFEHSRVWQDVMRRCQEAAEEAKRANSENGETMMLGYAAFAGMIAASYRKANEPH